MGLAFRCWDVARSGLVSAAIRYLALILSAALVFLALRWTGVATAEEFVGNSQVQELASLTLREVLLSACGAVAGMIMMLSYRRYLIPGALVALMIIEAAMVGMALAAGEPTLMYEGLERFGLNVLLIVVGGLLVVLLKQTVFHRRAPIVWPTAGKTGRASSSKACKRNSSYGRGQNRPAEGFSVGAGFSTSRCRIVRATTSSGK
jgi:hypothetical protein